MFKPLVECVNEGIVYLALRIEGEYPAAVMLK